MLLQVNGVSKKNGEETILYPIDFTIDANKRLAIAGETGSGKSTLMKIMAGISSPDTGTVYFNGERIKRIPDEKLLPGHPGIAYLSQHFELPNHYWVHEILGYANAFSEADANELFELCSVQHLLQRKTHELSGGERQRVALAKLLISSPKFLLLDEPFSNLDMIHKQVLKVVINNISEKLGITCVLVSHDPNDTLSWADEIMVLRGGHLVQKSTPKDIYYRPNDAYVAGLFGSNNLVPPALAAKFQALSGIETGGHDLFIRPELFKIAASHEQGLSGIVKKISFYGSFYEVDVVVEGYLLVVRTSNLTVNIGERISINID